MRGVIWDGQDLVVTDELEVREPGPGEVQVRLVASGICHSDVNLIERGTGSRRCVVPGHEGAGEIARLGEGVTGLRVGESVVVTCQVPCGTCRYCMRGRYTECPTVFGQGSAPPFAWRGELVHAYANSSSFAGMVTVKSAQVLPAEGLNPFSAALIGCAVSTGYGGARNAAQVGEGDTVVVFGIGGIGINALQTARYLKAERIVAVDVVPEREELARRFGAGAFVAAPREAESAELVDLVREVSASSIDATIECSGAPAAVAAAVDALGRGGRAALIGIPPMGTRVSFDVNILENQGQRIVGSLNGSIDPYRDMPEIMRLVRDGQLEIDAQVTKVFPLGEVKAAIEAMKAGKVVRAVLDHTA
jgi:S-(hydroxymethyl)glutathione dehydrogenase/alcohol dehydrogenase